MAGSCLLPGRKINCCKSARCPTLSWILCTQLSARLCLMQGWAWNSLAEKGFIHVLVWFLSWEFYWWSLSLLRMIKTYTFPKSHGKRRQGSLSHVGQVEGGFSNVPCISKGSGALITMKLPMALKLAYRGLCRRKNDTDKQVFCLMICLAAFSLLQPPSNCLELPRNASSMNFIIHTTNRRS